MQYLAERKIRTPGACISNLSITVVLGRPNRPLPVNIHGPFATAASDAAVTKGTENGDIHKIVQRTDTAYGMRAGTLACGLVSRLATRSLGACVGFVHSADAHICIARLTKCCFGVVNAAMRRYRRRAGGVRGDIEGHAAGCGPHRRRWIFATDAEAKRG